ncbi:hypothetical protein MHYP_G00276760 [Metynnis hypsauchen]
MSSASAQRRENCLTNLSQEHRQIQAYKASTRVEQLNISAQVKTESDEDPIWACYASSVKEWDVDVCGIKTEDLRMKSEPTDCDEPTDECDAIASLGVCDQKVLSALASNQKVDQQKDSAAVRREVAVKDEDPIWACYNTITGNENQKAEISVKPDHLPIKQEDSETVRVLPGNETLMTVSTTKSLLPCKEASKPGTSGDPTVHQTYKAPQVVLVQSNNVQPIPLFLCPVNVVPNENLEPAQAMSYSMPKWLFKAPRKKRTKAPLGQKEASKNSQQPDGENVVQSPCVRKKLDKAFCQNCQHCQKSIQSHYEKGCKHKCPKSSKLSTSPRNWKCCQCSIACVTSGKLIYHLLQKHKPYYPCQTCGVTFISHRKLEYHRHSHKPPVSCEVCKKVFPSSFHLKLHSRTHSEEYIKFFCELCGKGFRQKATLQTHMTVHTGDRPHECPDCKATFKAKSHMLRHRVTHTDLKPFPCPVCQTGFRTKGNMQAHLKNHDKNSVKKGGDGKRGVRKRKRKKVLLSESEEEEEEW